jgi:cystathionine gamma-lyase
MTHASVPDDQRALLGIDDSLIRLSVGVESCHDLVHDVKQALEAVMAMTKDNDAE